MPVQDRVGAAPAGAPADRPDVGGSGPPDVGRAEWLRRWAGLPPVGTRPIDDRWRFFLELVLLFALWFVLWIAWRLAAELLLDSDGVLYGILAVIMAPTISLVPPILWWRYRLRERGLPYLFTRKNLFSSVLVACLAVVVVFVLIYVSYPLMIGAMGVEPEEDLQFFASFRAETLEWLLYTTFLYMFIVGPVEELYHRGFVQDQLNRRFPVYFGIFVASVVFVLAHVPIDFLVHRLTLAEWGLRWLSSFPFAVAMGVYYHWSRNIWGPAVYHGLYDWFLGISNVEYGVGGPELAMGQWYLIYFVWFAVIEMGVIVLFSYTAYRALWKGPRPAGSLGFRVIGVSRDTAEGGLLRRVYAFVSTRNLVRLARRVDRLPRRRRTIWSVVAVTAIILGHLGFAGALGVVPERAAGGGPGPDGGDGYGGRTETLPLETEGDYAYEGETLDYVYHQGSDRKYVFINVTLRWQDEPPADARFTNEPDELQLELLIDWGDGFELEASDAGRGGSVELEWGTADPSRAQGVMVSVTAVNCGDQVPMVSPFSLRDRPDNGNTFSMETELTVAAPR